MRDVLLAVRSIGVILLASAASLLSGCLAALGPAAGGAANASIGFLKSGDTRFTLVGDFEKSDRAIREAVATLGYDVLRVDDSPSPVYPRRTWQLRDIRGSSARIVLTQHTEVVSVVLVDVNLTAKGSSAAPLTSLVAQTIRAAHAGGFDVK